MKQASSTSPANCGTLQFGSFALHVDLNDIALLKIDGPEKVNLISVSVLDDLSAVLDHLESRKDIKGLVVYSGKDSFIAGADIKDIVKAQSLDPQLAFEASQRGKAVFARLSALPFKSVAAIHGRCLGGGMELALACTYRLATDDESTLLGLPEVALGVIPGWGGTTRTGKIIGLENAAKLILDPMKPWNARKAWRLGLVSEVVPKEHMLARAVFLARRAYPSSYKPKAKERIQRFVMESFLGRAIFRMVARQQIQKKTGGKYPALFAALDVLLASFRLCPTRAAQLESQTFAKLCHTPESKEAVQTFLNRKSSAITKTAAGEYRAQDSNEPKS